MNLQGGADFIMVEHAAWYPGGNTFNRVLNDDRGNGWLARASQTRLSLRSLAPVSSSPGPALDLFEMPPDLQLASEEHTMALRSLGVVGRLPNPSLWNALATAIVQHLATPRQASTLYKILAVMYGNEWPDDGDSINYYNRITFPSPLQIMHLTEQQFQDIQLLSKRRALRETAHAFLSKSGEWEMMEPAQLVEALQEVQSIGAWTARLAVTDWSNDWSLYPFAETAVKTWAAHNNSPANYPPKGRPFDDFWREQTGRHLGVATLLSVAWMNREGLI